MSQSEPVTRETSVVTSGVLPDTRSFKWEIDNFAVICESLDLINAQKFRFNIGESVGLPTTWSCYLYQHPNSERKSIRIFFELLEKPRDVKKVNISLEFAIKMTDDSGENFVHETVPLETMDYKSVCGELIAENKKEAKKLPLVEGALVIDIDFTLYAIKQEAEVSADVRGKLETFKTKSLEQLSKDLSEVDTLASSTANLVTKIFSKDGMQFSVNRGILSARSPVFQRMFATKMKEGITGEVRIDDLSGKTLGVLLGYIYTGILHQNWNESEEVVQELTYAAHKYDLGLLTEFLDDVYGSGFRNDKKARSIWQRIWGRRKRK